MKQIKQYIQTTAKAVAPTLLLLLFLLPACSKESSDIPEVPEIKYAKLTITLGSADNAEPGFTKAYDPETGLGDNDIINPDTADSDYEHYIDDWYIVVVDKSGKVDRVVSYTDANNTDPNSETTVEMELIVGETYSFYALANLKGLNDGGKTIIENLEKLPGTSFNDFRKTAVELKELSAYTGGENTSYIPMSSYVETKTVSENIGENEVVLSLIRLLGKIEISVTNSTGIDVTVTKVEMGKFRQSGSLYLLPYDAIDKDPSSPNLLIGKGTGDDYKLMNPVFPKQENTPVCVNWSYDTGREIEGNATEPLLYPFYINETDQESVDADGGDMKITLNVTGDGLEKLDNDPRSTKFFFIRRNDLLKIPVIISNAKTTTKFYQEHMPIGGLPKEYTFNPGVTVGSHTFETDHAGRVTISYDLAEMNGVESGWSLKYYKKKDEGGNNGEVTSADHFCYAAPIVNTPTSNGEGYILTPEEDEKDPNISSWWNLSAYGGTQPTWAFKLNRK